MIFKSVTLYYIIINTLWEKEERRKEGKEERRKEGLTKQRYIITTNFKFTVLKVY